MTGIAKQYALAIFSLAEENKSDEAFKQKLSAFSQQIDEEMLHFFNHPKISKKEKQAILTKIVDDRLLLNFLKVLVDNDRFSLLEAIDVAYQELLDDKHKIKQAKVYASRKLSQQNIDKIRQFLEKKYAASFHVEVILSPEIIGGFRIEFEGNVIDETINKQLENLKLSLSE